MRSWFLAAAGALALGLAMAGETGTPTPGTTGGPPGKPVKLLFSVNNFGFIDVCGCPKKKLRQGSVTRRSSFLKQLRGRNEPILVADSGNTLFDEANLRAQEFEKPQLIDKAKVIVESYNRMGYRVLAVGHLDLAMGLEQLLAYRDMAKFPFICANLVDKESGEPIFPPTAEVETNGVKVGFLGLIVNSLESYYLEKRAPRCKVVDGIEAAKNHIPGLRARNDLVVVLASNKLLFNQKLAEEVPGIDLIVDPFLGETNTIERKIEPGEYCQEHAGVIIARTRPEGHSLGTVEFHIVDGGRPLVNRADGNPVPAGRSSYLYKREPIEPHMLQDPEIDLLVEAFKAGTGFVSTAALPPLSDKAKYLTAETCKACHGPQYEWWQKTQHARAFAGLEATNDQWRQDCIGCHTLGYGAAFILPADAEPYKNVQCESCHGLNPEHPSDPKAHPWKKIPEEKCLACHNEGQTREKFNFPPMRKKVACPKAR